MKFNISSLIGLLILLVFGYFAIRILRLVYIGLLFLLPITIIITLVVRPEIIRNYFRKLITKIKASPGSGILNTILSLFLLPFTSIFMMGQALLYKKLDPSNEMNFDLPSNQPVRERKDEFIEFEDLSNREENKDRLKL
ncbi:MAG TPA: hypothetical protein PK076_12810 [Saprospiraceae bacterium]|nr:hypothetical protein [Saprospiraceae bacterium]HQW57007.1 hypothetical protein [Saprospiraceae bacterium]